MRNTKKQKENRLKNLKNANGITLIALVITIIVLLILAAASIATLTGENGILTRASDAKIETEKATEEEILKLAIISAKISNDGTQELTSSKLQEELDKQNQNIQEKVTVVDARYGILEVIFEDSQRGYKISENGEIYDLSYIPYTDIYVYLCSDWTLLFSNSENVSEKNIEKSYGNIKFQTFEEIQIDDIYTAQTPWINDRENITSIEILNNVVPVGNLNWFAGCYNASNIDLTNLNTTYIVSMRDMFARMS